MTADQRLDQLEPPLSEAVAVVDRPTAQPKQHSALLGQVVEAIAGQRENAGFGLRQLVAIKVEQANSKMRVFGVENKQGSGSCKLDLVLGLLGNTNN